MVQGAVPNPPIVRAREVARARAHGERAAAGRARAAREPAATARRTAGARSRCLVNNNKYLLTVINRVYLLKLDS